MQVALVCYYEAFLCSKITRFFANRAPILFLSVFFARFPTWWQQNVAC